MSSVPSTQRRRNKRHVRPFQKGTALLIMKEVDSLPCCGDYLRGALVQLNGEHCETHQSKTENQRVCSDSKHSRAPSRAKPEGDWVEMPPAEEFEELLRLIHPDTLKENLVRAAVYIIAYEFLENLLRDRLEDFYGYAGDGSWDVKREKLKPGKKYPMEVRAKDKDNLFVASCRWFEEDLKCRNRLEKARSK
jgi:hypothetical protein